MEKILFYFSFFISIFSLQKYIHNPPDKQDNGLQAKTNAIHIQQGKLWNDTPQNQPFFIQLIQYAKCWTYHANLFMRQ